MIAAYILVFCRISIALTFGWAFIGKIRNITAFRESVKEFQMLQEGWSSVIVWISLATEFIVVLFMVIGRVVLSIGFILAVILLLIFSVALVTVLQQKMKVSCNCFGSTERRVSFYDVARNMFFILCCLIGLWTRFSSIRNLPINYFTLISLMAICVVILMTNLADVVKTVHRPFHSS